MSKTKLVQYEITDKNDNVLVIVENTLDKSYNILYTDLGKKLESHNNIQVQSAIFKTLFEMKNKNLIDVI